MTRLVTDLIVCQLAQTETKTGGGIEKPCMDIHKHTHSTTLEEKCTHTHSADVKPTRGTHLHTHTLDLR